MEIIKKIYIKQKEVIKYLLFGILNTMFNFIIYMLLTRLLCLEEITSNILAWIFSVLFAYVTNKFFVFNSKKKVISEIMKFIVARILTCIVCNIILFSFLIRTIYLSDIAAKIIVQIIITLLNYLVSKVIVFNNSSK